MIYKELIEKNDIQYLSTIKNNEDNTQTALLDNRGFSQTFNQEYYEHKIYYVTDIHLVHRIINSKCKNYKQVQRLIDKIVDRMLSPIIENIESNHNFDKNIILIGGDVSSEYKYYEMFVKSLSERLGRNDWCFKIMFILGNHELWAFSDKTFEEIVEIYRELLKTYNMQLLQNEIVYVRGDEPYDDKRCYWGRPLWSHYFELIDEEELRTLTNKEINERLKFARFIIFAGMGFAGNNNEFNADMGIYRNALSRTEEIERSRLFYELYKKIVTNLNDKNVVVFTHMPLKDWAEKEVYEHKFAYISGHTHRNVFHDDGITRIYADNQIGYFNENVNLKFLYINKTYDWFSKYTDGIYEISKDDYICFYRGKNIRMNYNRDDKIYMLKKSDYYCFITQNLNGSLCLLNGGQKTKLKNKEINYYYQNMDKQIESINYSIIGEFQKYLMKVSKVVKSFGGSGKIHGCIVDIDFFTHLYVNIEDGSITPYYAENVIYKYVYPNVESLLNDWCPKLIKKYKNLLGTGKKEVELFRDEDVDIINRPIAYLDTDIYQFSRVMNKVQRLNSNVLSVWGEDISLAGVQTPKIDTEL